MEQAILDLGTNAVLEKVMHYAEENGVAENLHIDYVCKVCCNTPELAPKIGNGKKTFALSADQRIEQWVKKFKHGYDERISQRQSKTPGTIPDFAVSIIINAGLPKLTKDQVQSVIYAHRLAMSAENILGLLLEEFLFEKLSPHGWAMAWGETVKSVDFCNENGVLLQIKNRSNSENSSSSKIRDGKPIEKWFRVQATTGQYEWSKLSGLIGQTISGLNEESFQGFITKTLSDNPDALAIESQNPWMQFKK